MGFRDPFCNEVLKEKDLKKNRSKKKEVEQFQKKISRL